MPCRRSASATSTCSAVAPSHSWNLSLAVNSGRCVIPKPPVQLNGFFLNFGTQTTTWLVMTWLQVGEKGSLDASAFIKIGLFVGGDTQALAGQA